MMKITHQEIDDLNSLLSHPGRKTLVAIIQSKVDDLSKSIDSLQTKQKDNTYNNTEVTILRKLFLREVVGLPNEITEIFKWDQNIAHANKKLQEWFEQLEKD